MIHRVRYWLFLPTKESHRTRFPRRIFANVTITSAHQRCNDKKTRQSGTPSAARLRQSRCPPNPRKKIRRNYEGTISIARQPRQVLFFVLFGKSNGRASSNLYRERLISVVSHIAPLTHYSTRQMGLSAVPLRSTLEFLFPYRRLLPQKQSIPQPGLCARWQMPAHN